MRVLLLFGYVIFESVMDVRYYQHLLKLVLMMHLCENRKVHLSQLDMIHRLGQTFAVDFVALYGQRHCVQVVHSVTHVADTVRDFGPLSSFTTIQFENELGNLLNAYYSLGDIDISLGLLTRLTKSTRRHGLELIGNLRILQQAYSYLNNDCILDPGFRDFALHLSSSHAKVEKHIVRVTHPTKKTDHLASLYFSTGRICFYNSVHIGSLRLCTRTHAENKVADDSNIIFLFNGSEHPGRIRSIFTIDDSEPLLLVGYLSKLIPFTCQVDGKKTAPYPHIRQSNG